MQILSQHSVFIILEVFEIIMFIQSKLTAFPGTIPAIQKSLLKFCYG